MSRLEGSQWITFDLVLAMKKSTCFIQRGKSSLSSDYSIGIIGLGFGYKTDLTPWIVEAYQRSHIPAPAYSLTLGRYSDSESDGSLLVIGGYDTDLVDGVINWIRSTSNIHFQIPMDGIIVNGVTIKRKDNRPMQAIIDVFLLNR